VPSVPRLIHSNVWLLGHNAVDFGRLCPAHGVLLEGRWPHWWSCWVSWCSASVLRRHRRGCAPVPAPHRSADAVALPHVRWSTVRKSGTLSVPCPVRSPLIDFPGTAVHW